jgi:hypothetical protein
MLQQVLVKVLQVLEQVKVLLDLGQQDLVQQDLVQQGLGQQVMVLLVQAMSMELLSIHQTHLNNNIRKPGTLT